jgi:2,4-dienoyl-CoA reductase (NADPH2)
MSSTFDHLLAPGRIGSMELRNRIVMSPMGDDLCHEDGTVSDAQLAYAEARAAGGVSLVMLGSVAVAHPVGTSNRCQTGISDDRFLPGLMRLADAVHAQGSKIALQLTHAGKVGINDMMAGRAMWVPSPPKAATFDPLFAQVTPDEAAKQAAPMHSPTFRIAHHEMTKADIAVVIEWFADAVDRARRAGIDGCELHAGHGYLIDEFLSPSTNSRTDEYGGSVENRARLLVETLHAVRDRVGPDYPVWVRINAHEYFTDGETLPDAIFNAQLAEQAGADAVHVSTYADPAVAIGFTESHTTHFPGHMVEYAREIKRHVSVPVIAVGRIEPEVGERLIAENACDFIAMGRKLLADPELPNKLAAGRALDIRPCMYHYRCISQIFIREGVRCASNAATGRENELRVEPAPARRKILVVGGGPAGMEAARLAALRGHEVTLLEASDRLGGRLVYAAQTYAPNADVLRWLVRQVEQAGVEVKLSTRVDAEAVKGCGADVVIAAIGGRWARPDVTGGASAHVHTVDDLDAWLVSGRPLPGARVVVIGGGRAGMGLADLASRQGHAVTVLERSGVFASQIGLPGRWRLVHELQQRGVDLVGNATVTAIEHDLVRYTVDDESRTAAGDIVLVAECSSEPNVGVDILKSTDVPVHSIGDCTGAGFIEGAMLDAATLAVSL